MSRETSRSKAEVVLPAERASTGTSALGDGHENQTRGDSYDDARGTQQGKRKKKEPIPCGDVIDISSDDGTDHPVKRCREETTEKRGGNGSAQASIARDLKIQQDKNAALQDALVAAYATQKKLTDELETLRGEVETASNTYAELLQRFVETTEVPNSNHSNVRLKSQTGVQMN
ncbi:uncharacterized protein C8Q71DRAFT_854370 [Rhodofomes roseus]|uniref:BZIP transcription factor n=1 Tax=Rhodofomes roseus TaxID=34475 RepID=A0ABQ8KTD4_9APHY|nr:uncharacterized protein C8Q71DRAFT_854370 [Rhodofomes roseus]KAH9842017.1 hypothetical protein C8Q71DRAFT_854370 [Rhodofomes roseus]